MFNLLLLQRTVFPWLVKQNTYNIFKDLYPDHKKRVGEEKEKQNTKEKIETVSVTTQVCGKK